MMVDSKPYHFRYMVIAILSLMLANGCKKDEFTPEDEENIEWMRVLDNNVTINMEDNDKLGQNGKVLVDQENNIFIYYYSAMPRKAVVIKLDPSGELVWEKSFPDCIPMDMVRRHDGHLVLATRDKPGHENWIVFYDILPDGNSTEHIIYPVSQGASRGVINANMYVRSDNSIVLSGSYFQSLLVGFPLSQDGFIMGLTTSFTKIFNTYIRWRIPEISDEPVLGQNSIVPASGNKLLVQYELKSDPVQTDSLVYGLATAIVDPMGGIINPDSAVFDTAFVYTTGYRLQSKGKGSGFYNEYTNELIPLTGESIFHYSAPVSLSSGMPPSTNTPNGFLRIGNDGQIKDTIPLDLPDEYRLISCTKGPDGFLATAYERGGISPSGDFNANQTLFIKGTNNWQVTGTFRFQQFYSDLFPSVSPSPDGGYLMMGKIQSFNGHDNQLVVIKWKDK